MRMLIKSVGSLLLFAPLLFAGCNNEQGGTTATDRDNTAVNERDADSDTKTPFDQSNEQSDIDLVAKIRQEVLEIDDLSTNGRNVKIITNEGKVVLRGPVETVAERDAIAKVANAAAGDVNVDNQLEVTKD